MIKFHEQYDIQLVDKEDIRVGDIILCSDGKIRTVCKKDIRYDGGMGLSIFGNSYKLGYEKVKKVINLRY